MLSVPSCSPKRCRQTVWPVEVVAAAEGGIGVAQQSRRLALPVRLSSGLVVPVTCP